MKNGLTATERRGVIVVALVALIITAFGFFISKDQNENDTVMVEEVRVMAREDSVAEKEAKTSKKKSSKKSSKKKGGKSSAKKKQYGRRSPIDEEV